MTLAIKGILVALTFVAAIAQKTNNNITTPTQTPIDLDKIYTVDLQPNQTQTWTLVLNADTSKSNDLFVTIQSPPNQPLQQPFLTLSTSNQDLQFCYAANDQFSGICRIDRSDLTPNETIYITAQCVVPCHLTMYAQLSTRYQLSVEDTLILRSPSMAANQYQFEMEIPQNLKFDQIAIFAQISDYSRMDEGIQLYANIGKQDAPIPTSTKYDVGGQPIYWGGLGLFFSKQDLSVGRYIKIYISLPAQTEVKLSSRVTVGNQFVVTLGQSYFDYTSAKQPKTYYLDLKNYMHQIAKSTIVIGFVIYGGSPIIRISFDPSFTTSLKGTDSYGTMTFIITDSIRTSLNFTGLIYINVISQWNADYFFYSVVNSKNYINLIPDIGYYNSIPSQGVFNYFFDQTLYVNASEKNISTKHSFAIKIDSIKGLGTFGVRRCIAAETQNNPLLCLLNTALDISNNPNILSQFLAINVTITRSDQFSLMVFQYDLSTCTKIPLNNSEITQYYCSFHYAAVNTGKSDIQYTIMLAKRSYSSNIRQGQLVKDTIFKNQYLFYRFSLSTIDKVEEVIFYITVLEGSVTMLASTNDTYPDFNSDDPKLKTSSSQRIVFKQSQLSKKYYIGVLGEQFSQFTLGVIVKRHKDLVPIDNSISNQTDSNSESNSASTKLQLQLGINQQFILKVGEANAVFFISSQKPINATIQIVQLVGTVKMVVKDYTGKKVNCNKNSQSSTKLTCDVFVDKGQSYDIIVSGTQGLQQKFIIVYYRQQNCIPYSLNLPFYQQLPVSVIQCASFSITEAKDLELTISASINQLLHGDLLVQICTNGKCKTVTKSHHQELTQSEISAFCQFGKSQVTSCPIIINFSNNSTSTLSFSFILEQKGRDVALFDGITEKVYQNTLSTKKAKQFYFQMESKNTIRIFFTSFTQGQYCILGHFISQRQFLENSIDIYVQYQTKQTWKTKGKDNYYQFYKFGPGTTVFTASLQQIEKQCENCMLTLSVYVIQTGNSHHLSIFQLEASQQETALIIGQSKIGYVQQDQIYVYQLEQPVSNDALLFIKDLTKQSFSQKNCFKVSLSDLNVFNSEQALIIPKKSTKLNLYVTTEEDYCSFQISYSFLQNSIISVSEGRSYSFQAKQNQTTYFIFDHHATYQSFKVVTILSTGEAQISVNSISKQKSIKDLISINPSNFSFVGDQNQNQIFVKESSPNYCSSCSYIIAIYSKNGAQGELFISKLNSSVPLSINGVIKEKIKMNDSIIRNYTFSSITSFNVSVNVIYGNIKVTVINHDNKILHTRVINSSDQIRVKHNKDTQNMTFEYNSYLSTFKINVEASIDSSFTIKASKIAISQRLFQGIITYAQVFKDKPYIFEFSNLQGSKGKDGSSNLNLLIEIVDQLQDDANQTAEINVTASFTKKQTLAPVPIIPQMRLDSESTINIQYLMQKGDYYFNLTSDQKVVVSILLVKESLIHLKPESTVLMSTQSVFELYSPLKSVMLQIFSCQGDLAIQATDDYSNFLSNTNGYNEIILEQSNYGGHFVVSAEHIFGQYFIKVKNRKKQGAQVVYILNYYYYDKEDVQPYQLLDLNARQITYSLSTESITFLIQPITIKSTYKDYLKEIRVQYYLYLANNKYKVSKYANCRMDSVIVVNASKTTEDNIQFTINFKELAIREAIYFVGAEAIVSLKPLKDNQHYPHGLKMIYDIIEISNSRAPYFDQNHKGPSVKSIILWTLLPFALAGVILFFALRFCIKKYKGMVPDQFVEETAESGEVVNGGTESQKKRSNASGTFKDEIDE